MGGCVRVLCVCGVRVGGPASRPPARPLPRPQPPSRTFVARPRGASARPAHAPRAPGLAWRAARAAPARRGRCQSPPCPPFRSAGERAQATAGGPIGARTPFTPPRQRPRACAGAGRVHRLAGVLPGARGAGSAAQEAGRAGQTPLLVRCWAAPRVLGRWQTRGPGWLWSTAPLRACARGVGGRCAPAGRLGWVKHVGATTGRRRRGATRGEGLVPCSSLCCCCCSPPPPCSSLLGWQGWQQAASSSVRRPAPFSARAHLTIGGLSMLACIVAGGVGPKFGPFKDSHRPQAEVRGLGD